MGPPAFSWITETLIGKWGRPISLCHEAKNCLMSFPVTSGLLRSFSEYWQILMSLKCKEKTTFVCYSRIFQFKVMSFGKMNAPTTFQRMMDTLLRGVSFVRAYLGDVVIASPPLDRHSKYLRSAMGIFGGHGLKLEARKCSFAQQKRTFTSSHQILSISSDMLELTTFYSSTFHPMWKRQASCHCIRLNPGNLGKTENFIKSKPILGRQIY